MAFDVYRTYVDESGAGQATDLCRIDDAIARAGGADPDLDPDLLDLLRRILRADPDADGQAARELRMRFQQLTGPTMAKGVEDTALYRHLGVLAANEVGGNPGRPSGSTASFHAAQIERADRGPASMVALTTHDTKRSEDVRARLAVLSERPERWGATVQRWTDRNRAADRAPRAPDRLTEYLIYQTLVGAHPLSIDRARDYVRKAMREAKRATSWLEPDEEAERTAIAFLEAILADEGFTADVAAFVGELQESGRTNSLAMKLLQLTVPGVPDLYQGSELWLHTLVDPDNRGPVDFDLRRKLLADLAPTASELPRLIDDEVGETKLFITRAALTLRTQRPYAFGPGADYAPCTTSGAYAENAMAFTRAKQVAVVVPRPREGRPTGWADTTVDLRAGTWTDVLGSSVPAGTTVGGGIISLADLLHHLPVALLAREDR